MSSTIAELARDLDCVSRASSDVCRAIEILKQLELQKVNPQILLETKVGILVNNLKKHSNPDIQAAASKVVKIWKSAVLPTSATTTNQNINQTSNSAASVSTSLPLSSTVVSGSDGSKTNGTFPSRSAIKEKESGKTGGKEATKTTGTEEKEPTVEKDQDNRTAKEKSISEKDKNNSNKEKDGSKSSSLNKDNKKSTAGITKSSIKEEKIAKEKEKEKIKESKGKKRKSKSPEREEEGEGTNTKKPNTGKEKEKEGNEKIKKVSPPPKRNLVSPAPISRPPTASSSSYDDEPDHPVDGIYRLGSHSVEIRNKIQKMIYDALGNPPPDFHPVPLATRTKRMKGNDSEKENDDEKAGRMEEDSSGSSAKKEAGKETCSSTAESSNSSSSSSAGPKSPFSVSIPPPGPSGTSYSPLPSPTTSSSGMDVDRTELTYLIELAMFVKFQRRTDQDYRVKARNVVYALNDKSNPDINFHLYRGLLDPDTFLNFSEKDLASEDLKEKRRKAWEWSRAAARSDLATGEANSDQFACEKCGERKCKYYMQQTRGADEPMTVFVTCLACGHKFRSGDNS